ncbi:MAG: hypothetical protein ACOX7G_10725 [Candidatus Scatomorpha sp.]|jgi:hypothetical protein
MRKLALTLTCTTCVYSAFGIFSRWLQNMTAFEENGLYISGSLWGIVLTLLCIAAAGTIFGFARYYKKNLGLTCAPDPGVAFAGSGMLHKIIYLVITLIMAAGSVMLLITAGDAETPLGMDFSGLLRILALLGLLTAGGFLGIAGGANGKETPDGSPRQAGFCLAATLPIAFCCFWLIVSYRQDAVTSVVWSYAPEILAIACSLLSFYYVAGHAYGRGKPFATIFFCNFGAFLCFVTLPDERLIAQQIMFFGIAGMQLFLSWMLVSGLRRREEIFARFPNAPATEDEDDEVPPPKPEDEFEPMGPGSEEGEENFVELPGEYIDPGTAKTEGDKK